MNPRPLYQAIADLVTQHARCVGSTANESQRAWAPNVRNKLSSLCLELMPSGSGIDTGTTLDLDASTSDKLVFGASFHHMDEHGSYDGWTDHTIIVRPSQANGFTLRITGPDRNDIKEYLHDCFDMSLRQLVQL